MCISLKKYDVNWLRILEEVASSDLCGHETWFIVGCEQHGKFYYCAIGDCSVTPEEVVRLINEEVDKDGNELEKILREKNRYGLVYIGKSLLNYDDAIREALSKLLKPIHLRGLERQNGDRGF